MNGTVAVNNEQIYWICKILLTIIILYKYIEKQKVPEITGAIWRVVGLHFHGEVDRQL